MPAPTRALRIACLALAGLLTVTSGALAQEEPAAPAPPAETLPADTTAEAPAEVDATAGWMDSLDAWFGDYLVTPLVTVLFYDFESERWLGTSVPFVVAWLLLGAIYLTLRMGFINVRAFWHAVKVVRGSYDDPDDEGEVTHFQALASALSATVGLGNIAGVAIAVGTGGPGAVFWMILAGLLGMSSKFTECTLGQMYRRVDDQGNVSGGPMRYLSEGLEDLGMAWLGKPLAIFFALLCFGGSLGGGCSFQVSQSMDVVKSQLPWLEGREWVYGAVMVTLVGIVILGGIKRIASTAEKIVPLMCVIYVAAALTILGMNFSAIPAAFGTIFSEAFKWESAFGGFLGVMVVGIKRAVFSNEAGIGSAAIAHSAAKTQYAVREGIVALLEPFIDTVVICTMTGLVIVITGAYDTARFPEHAEIIVADQGATLTSNAFATQISWFPMVLALAASLFAYSTMISWSYYGERCFTYLFGAAASLPYKLIFLCFVFLGAVVTARNVNVFSELMILSMALPNMLGLFLLSKKVKLKLDDYWQAYKMGDFEADIDRKPRLKVRG
ncbi:Amino-acid carrier protein AlsT [Botrimarina colliarenosi]|uniref:Amino-acid carrier protein AlsT n=1 Tax=Botrimarina colliarenosi TaxID=2528001 RepID=A0A5C6AKL1_9BACT|nr:alanine/glycine:cation symporter family protein [Botrimarina colliarenosi]TWT99705.1 Amino-acid carrier protein AlsT [Botrimarina colliarenosi]